MSDYTITEEQRVQWLRDAGEIPPAGPVPHDLNQLHAGRDRRYEVYRGCSATVTRDGEEDACEKPAFGAITTWWEGEWITWPVCAYHAHMLGGREYCELVPLHMLISGCTP